MSPTKTSSGASAFRITADLDAAGRHLAKVHIDRA